ncbi:hypothetical protein L1887_18289 [Cichorium endivia]|nr:hypothetical protein L1887_18289 [Cichorium endivia]
MWLPLARLKFSLKSSDDETEKRKKLQVNLDCAKGKHGLSTWRASIAVIKVEDCLWSIVGEIPNNLV